MSRLGHLLVFSGVLLAVAALALNASAWPGATLAAVGALLVAVDGLAQWAEAEESTSHLTRTTERLDVLEARVARLSERLETAERRDALGRM